MKIMGVRENVMRKIGNIFKILFWAAPFSTAVTVLYYICQAIIPALSTILFAGILQGVIELQEGNRELLIKNVAIYLGMRGGMYFLNYGYSVLVNTGIFEKGSMCFRQFLQEKTARMPLYNMENSKILDQKKRAERTVEEDVPAGMGDIAIYTEMGRFMMGPYGALVTKAVHEKHIYKEYIGVDACAANLMRPAMYGAYHHITVLGKENAPCDHIYDVAGSLCENNDKFAIDRNLPKIDMGDYLFIHDAGAHGFSMGYNYNGRLRSAEILLQEDGTAKLIRRAETPKDYFATFDCFDFYKNLKFEK